MMQEKFEHRFGKDFGNPDFVQLAESFGVKGVRPTLLSEFEQALKDALHQTNELTLIDAFQK
jgi:acetolactate synthase-1/2/3 large subunit